MREEVQRYFGYEDLLYRYVSIPYDATMQVNQSGKFVDVGYVIFALMPIALLVLCYRHKKLFYTVLLLSFLYLFLCYRFSFLRDNLNNQYYPSSADVAESSSSATGWTHGILESLYIVGSAIAAPMTALLDQITGPTDYITYPFLAAILAIMLLISQKLVASKRMRIMWAVGVLYFFLWWILGGGIIWYGLLALPLGYIIIFKMMNREVLSTNQVLKTSIIIPCIAFYIMLAFILRISNITYIQGQNPDYGKTIVDQRLFPYIIGNDSKRESLGRLSLNLPVAVDKMNSDNHLIYQCGSSINYEISYNDKRVFEDNTLSFFYDLTKSYPTRQKLSEYFVSVGIKYLIVDLNIPFLDKTPEKSLTTKYKLMLAFLKDNNRAKLIATDQVVKIQQADGSMREFASVFGGDISRLGSYALFEIK